MSRWRSRRDTNERAIVAALELCGVVVFKVEGPPGMADLLCYFQGIWKPVEVKTDRKIHHKSAAKTFTKAQQRMALKRDLVSWPVVKTIDEALAVFGLHPKEVPPHE